MIYLLLTILMNVIIFLAFRSFSQFKINTFPAIITNYLVCVLTGILFTGPQQILANTSIQAPWFLTSIVLGILFVFTFYLMAKTTQMHGVAVATVASKMSLAVPVFFSLFIFQVAIASLNFWHYLGIALAFVAIVLVTKRHEKSGLSKLRPRQLLLPFSIFLLGGLIDTSLNFINQNLITDELNPIFLIYNFLFAFIAGLGIALAKKIKVKTKDILGGIYLGIPNYFSVYFLLKTLTNFENNGALVYPTVNVGIIIGSTLIAMVLFNEKLNRTNWIGIAVSILAIIFLSHQEMLF